MSASAARPALSAEYLAADRGTQILVVVILCPTLAFLIVTLRLYTRLRITKTASREDYAIVLATVFSIAWSVCQIIQVKHGLGRHIEAVNLENTITSLKALYASIVFYVFGLFFTKMSIYFQFLRLSVEQPIRIFCWVSIWFTVAVGIEALFTGVLQCLPVARFWDFRIPGKCLNTTALYFTNAAILIVQDISCVVLPFFILRQLTMPRKEKISVMLVLCLGGFGAIASICRLHSVYVLTTSTDITWDNTGLVSWTDIELNVGIICASLPTLRAFIIKIWPTAFLSSLTSGRSASNNQGSEGHYYEMEGSVMRRSAYLFHMDPLSVTASILAIIGAAEKVTKGLQCLQELRNAQEDAQLCCNEISALKAVCYQIDHVQRQWDTKPQTQRPSDEIFELLNASLIGARSSLLKFDVLLQYRIIRPSDSVAGSSPHQKVMRHRWFIEKKKIEKFRNEVRQARSDLFDIVELADLDHSMRIGYQITSFMMKTEAISMSQADTNGQILKSLSDNQHTTENLGRNMETQFQTFATAISENVEKALLRVQRPFSSNGTPRSPLGVNDTNVVVIRKAVDENTTSTLESMFDEPDRLNELQFSERHRKVLGLPEGETDGPDGMNEHDVDTCDAMGRTPLQWAVLRNDLANVRSLLHCGASPNKQAEYSGETSMHFAARARDIDVEIIQLLLEHNGDINCEDLFAQTPLSRAIGHGAQATELLIRAGADVNMQDSRYGWTALHAAVFFGEASCVEALLAAGANPSLRTISGKNAVAFAHLSAFIAVLEVFSRFRTIMKPAFEEYDRGLKLDELQQYRQDFGYAPVSNEWWTLWTDLVDDLCYPELDFATEQPDGVLEDDDRSDNDETFEDALEII
ncbi:hypothetical protein E8E13_003882 [Curvularia kusanoi]|uniref:Rhodopsin domain-containing protein n=1 Tax=Curvularia kusanoi TaxID=90978 RepID=A0A9P4T758_CURKU|nr:hypothetical protein E8E13_003882 [Curvularia kusanoi]